MEKNILEYAGFTAPCWVRVLNALEREGYFNQVQEDLATFHMLDEQSRLSRGAQQWEGLVITETDLRKGENMSNLRGDIPARQGAGLRRGTRQRPASPLVEDPPATSPDTNLTPNDSVAYLEFLTWRSLEARMDPQPNWPLAWLKGVVAPVSTRATMLAQGSIPMSYGSLLGRYIRSTALTLSGVDYGDYQTALDLPNYLISVRPPIKFRPASSRSDEALQVLIEGTQRLRSTSTATRIINAKALATCAFKLRVAYNSGNK